MARSSAEIKGEIISRFGFFPPFFEPAMETPAVLESLWRQTLTDYIENPIPDLFKEKLAAMLGRYCTVPYCLMCHSSTLKPLGMTATEVLNLLETPPLNYDDLSVQVQKLGGSRLRGWPQPNSDLENAILSCCIAIFLNQDAEVCQRKLKQILEPKYYQHLSIFLSYNRTALSWAEMHPELNYKSDKRVQDHLGSLISSEPQLETFFKNYQGRVLDQAQRQTHWLTQENKRLLEVERRRLYSYFSQAPIGFAVVEEPDHRFVLANAKYEELAGRIKFQGKAIREVFNSDDYLPFFDLLDKAYETGKGFVERERIIRLDRFNTGNIIEIFVDITVEPYRNERGRIAGLFIILNEVTDQVNDRRDLIYQKELLRKSQQQLSFALESADMGTWHIDLNTNLVSASLGTAKLFGLDQIEGDIFEVVKKHMHRDDVDTINKNWTTAVKNNLPYYDEYRILRPNKEVRWVFSRGSVTLNENQQPLTFSGVIGDITDLKLAELQVKSEQKKFETIFHSSGSPMALFRGADLHFEMTNKKYSDLMSGRELNGKPVLEAIPEIKGSPVASMMKNVFETGVEQTLLEHVTFLHNKETGFVEKRFFDSTFTQILDADGKPYGIFGTPTEVTDRVLNRQILEAKELRLNLALQAAQIGTWDLEISTNTLKWSDRAAEIFGYPNADAISVSDPIQRIFSEDRPRVEAALKKAMTPGSDGRYDEEYRITHPNGETRWIYATGQAVFDPELKTVSTFAGTLLDVTESRISKDAILNAKNLAESANSAKSAFLANMSHEIRSPLGAIMGFSDLLKSVDVTQADIAHYVSVIDRNSHHLLRVIDDILDLAKVEAGKMEIEHIDFSLKELLEEFSVIMKYRAKDKGIDFAILVSAQVPSIINTDPTRLRQILNNAVGNAIKFTDRGQVTLSVSYELNKLTFAIIDTGVGISEDQVEKLFQPFQQADVSTTRKFGGTGLGLALTRRLSMALGGNFVLKSSSPGNGSVFVVTIAVDISTASESFNTQPLRVIESRSDKRSDTKPLSGMKILVVEDSPDNQVLFQLMLARAGASAEIAHDGTKGVELALKNPYDAILMDIQMPTMDGHEATKLLRDKGYKGTIIALTAHAMVEERGRATKSGFTDFLSKPIDRDDLTKMLLKYGKSN